MPKVLADLISEYFISCPTILSKYEGKRYECTHDGCNKSFTEASSLKTHRDSKHNLKLKHLT